MRRSAFSLPPTTHFASNQESTVRGRCTSPRTSSQSRLGPREFGEDASERIAFCTIHPYSLSLHHHRNVDCAIGAACTASGGVAHAAQPVSLAHVHNSARLRDSVHQATSQVQRRSRDVGGSPERPFSALATLPGPEVGMAPRYTLRGHHPAVSPLPQPLDRPCLSTGCGAPRTSVPAYCCHNRCLQHGLGHHMQWAGSLGALDRAPTALAHQLPRAVGSASSLTAVPATAVGQARVSLHGQHCGCLVHQPVGRFTITPHVTARPPTPPLESHAVQVTARCSHPGEAQSCGRRALTTAYIPRR